MRTTYRLTFCTQKLIFTENVDAYLFLFKKSFPSLLFFFLNEHFKQNLLNFDS